MSDCIFHIWKREKEFLTFHVNALGTNKEIHEVTNCRFTRASNHHCSLNKVHCANHVYIDKYIYRSVSSEISTFLISNDVVQKFIHCHNLVLIILHNNFIEKIIIETNW